MRQVKARLTAARGAIEHVVIFCDGWDSPAFEEEHREELEAHARQGVRFRFMLVGVPERVLGAVPVDLDRARVDPPARRDRSLLRPGESRTRGFSSPSARPRLSPGPSGGIGRPAPPRALPSPPPTGPGWRPAAERGPAGSVRARPRGCAGPSVRTGPGLTGRGRAGRMARS